MHLDEVERNLKMEQMNDYTFFIALAINICSLVALLFLFLYCRRIDRKCTHYIAKSYCERDHAFRETERIRIEKETIEKLFKAGLSELGENVLLKVKTKENVADKANSVLRIDITFLEKSP